MSRKKRSGSKSRSDTPRREGGPVSGTPMSPSALPMDEPREEQQHRAAPAPGVPIPLTEYERLKREAADRPASSEGPAQEDPSHDACKNRRRS